MSYTCSIITTNIGAFEESKCLYGIVVRGDSFGRTDGSGLYAWETHSFSDMGITSLRSPAGSNVYVMPYNSNSKNVYITSSDEPFATTYDYVSVNVLEHEFENSLGYSINRTIGSAPHYEDDHYYQYRRAGDAIQLANEPPNNHVFLDTVDPFAPNPVPTDSDLNNDTPFWFLTGSATVTLTAQGKTNTFYSYETWCNSIVNKSKPLSLNGKAKNINIKNNKAKYYEFQTAHSYLYKYRDVAGFSTNPTSKAVQSAVFEQLSSSWSRGNMKANGVATTMKYNINVISKLTSSIDVDLGIDILDVYLFHSESLSYMHDTYTGASIHFTEWNGNDDNPAAAAVTQSLLNTAQMLLSCARLKYESPNLRALTYQLGWSSSPSSLVHYISSTNEFKKTSIGYLYEHYKPAFWGTYIHTDMIGSTNIPLGPPNNRPRNVMVEAFIPYNNTGNVMVCWVNSTGSLENIDINIRIDNVNRGTLTLTANSYGSQSYVI